MERTIGKKNKQQTWKGETKGKTGIKWPDQTVGKMRHRENGMMNGIDVFNSCWGEMTSKCRNVNFGKEDSRFLVLWARPIRLKRPMKCKVSYDPLPLHLNNLLLVGIYYFLAFNDYRIHLYNYCAGALFMVLLVKFTDFSIGFLPDNELGFFNSRGTG